MGENLHLDIRMLRPPHNTDFGRFDGVPWLGRATGEDWLPPSQSEEVQGGGNATMRSLHVTFGASVSHVARARPSWVRRLA
jgi:hypothetical protein